MPSADDDWATKRLEQLLSSQFDFDSIPTAAPTLKKRKREDDNEETEDVDQDIDSSLEDTYDDEIDDDVVVDTRPEVETIVFQQASSTKSTPHSRAAWKQFMSSDVSKLSKADKQAKPVTKEEADQDRQDDLHDTELMDLLKTTKLVEQYTSGELTGRDRRDYMKKKLLELGAKGEKQDRHPLNIRLGMHKASTDRAEKRIKDAKETSMYHKSIKNVFSNDLELLGKTKRHRPLRKIEKGLKPTIGKFKDGVLHLNERDIRGGGSSRGSGSSRGGGRGGSRAGRGSSSGRGRGGKKR
ncbi:hypothetical protein SmJEL517_g04813 [Synchytrium microbalum]|uniref:Protein FAF1 n=1 Tax=Synchytrium microbalum TaxID=1806994 RepID=A0A507BQ02_9FUNG|nr:uncharacterized protein SmJEL517_g04813 [Synchytrium microbalum]TPX31980.1 hypothetical protein SmJEL517_g04813 [Synchytrium microbalum]